MLGLQGSDVASIALTDEPASAGVLKLALTASLGAPLTTSPASASLQQSTNAVQRASQSVTHASSGGGGGPPIMLFAIIILFFAVMAALLMRAR